MFHFIINPASKTGKGIYIWQEVKPFLAEQNIEFKAYKTSTLKNATYYTQNILNANPTGKVKIIVLGGDGTINEVLQGIKETDFDRCIIGYLPTGSSNDLARALGYDKNPMNTLKHLITSSAYRKMDIGLLKYNQAENPGNEFRYFIVSCGIGYDASVCEETSRSIWKKKLNKLKLGKLSYLAISLKQLLSIAKTDAEITVNLDGNLVLKKVNNCYFVAVLNHCYQGGGIKFSPDAVDNDGYLDICYASDISKARILYTLPKAFWGKHVGMKGVYNEKCQSVTINFNKSLWVHTDGEVTTKSNSITVSCLAKKLNFIV